MRRLIEIPLYERFLIQLNRFLAYKRSWTRSTFAALTFHKPLIGRRSSKRINYHTTLNYTNTTFAALTFSLFVRDSINNQSYSRKEMSIVCVFSVRVRSVSWQKNPMKIKYSYSEECSWAFYAISKKSVVWKPIYFDIGMRLKQEWCALIYLYVVFCSFGYAYNR